MFLKALPIHLGLAPQTVSAERLFQSRTGLSHAFLHSFSGEGDKLLGEGAGSAWARRVERDQVSGLWGPQKPDKVEAGS